MIKKITGIFDALKAFKVNVLGIFEFFKIASNLKYKEENLKLKEKILELQKENSKLKESLLDQCSMVFEKNVYYKINADDKKEGPFCSGCYDKDQKKIRLHNTTQNFNDYRCPICKVCVQLSYQRSVRVFS
ncbi:MAG: hypothetical protein LBB29_04055 [Holosporaceae bacterium]|jgi:hypothetical protein|nr:hypothetical protein [Holosporaceae bacterium]